MDGTSDGVVWSVGMCTQEQDRYIGENNTRYNSEDLDALLRGFHCFLLAGLGEEWKAVGADAVFLARGKATWRDRFLLPVPIRYWDGKGSTGKYRTSADNTAWNESRNFAANETEAQHLSALSLRGALEPPWFSAVTAKSQYRFHDNMKILSPEKMFKAQGGLAALAAALSGPDGEKVTLPQKALVQILFGFALGPLGFFLTFRAPPPGHWRRASRPSIYHLAEKWVLAHPEVSVAVEKSIQDRKKKPTQQEKQDRLWAIYAEGSHARRLDSCLWQIRAGAREYEEFRAKTFRLRDRTC